MSTYNDVPLIKKESGDVYYPRTDTPSIIVDRHTGQRLDSLLGDIQKLLTGSVVGEIEVTKEQILEIERTLEISGELIQSLQQLQALVDQSRTYKKVTGTGTDMILTLNAITSYYAGMSVHIIASENNDSEETYLTIDTATTLPIYKLGTTTTPNIIAGKPYTFIVSDDLTHFFQVASAEGNTIAEHVLAPDTFSNYDDTNIVGTMANNGPTTAATTQLTTEGSEYVIAKGYHSGLRKVKAVITGLIASVIKAGTTVGGILGTFTADATATASHMLANATAYVNGNKVTGNIPSKSAATITPGTTNQTIAASQYLSGAQTILGDANLVSGNIKAGATIFNISGNSNVVDTSSGDAVAADVLLNKKAFVDGALVTGNMPNITVDEAGLTAIGAAGRIHVRPRLGRWNGTALCYFDDPDFIAANFLATVNMFGLQGGIPVNSTDRAALEVNGAYVVGRLYMKPPTGSWNGNFIYSEDPDFIAANFLASKNVFGLQGSIPEYGDEEYAGHHRAAFVSASSGRVHLYTPKGAYLKTYDGTNVGIFFNDIDFIPSNILSNANVFGLQGDIPIVTPDIVDKCIARDIAQDGGNIYLGIYPNRYYRDINWVRAYDPDYIAANIINTANIFGLQGTAQAGIIGLKGTAIPTSGANKRSFYKYGSPSGLYDMNYIEVSGLTFKPRVIIAKPIGTSNPAYKYMDGCSIYISDDGGGVANHTSLVHLPWNNEDFTTREFTYDPLATTAACYVTSTGFCIPIANNDGSMTEFEWTILP